MEVQLAHLATLPSKDQANGYLSLLSEIILQPEQSSLAKNIHVLLEFVTQENVNIVVGRPVLAELVKALEDKRVSDRNIRKTIVEDCLSIIQPRLTRFEEQASRHSRP
jgi:COP9 signalosome complex subunit 4